MRVCKPCRDINRKQVEAINFAVEKRGRLLELYRKQVESSLRMMTLQRYLVNLSIIKRIISASTRLDI